MCLPIVNQAPPEPPAHAGQKQKKKRIQLNLQETARWEHDENRKEDIEDFIRSELKIVNDCAGLTVMPGAHKRRDDSYGLFVTGNTWVTNKGSITNTIFRCLLWERCKCPCEAKIMTSSTTTILFISIAHTALVVRGENLGQKDCKNFAHAIRWRFVEQRSRY